MKKLWKQRISKSVYGLDWYPHDQQYLKGKMHRGCRLCKFGNKYGFSTVIDIIEILREEILLEDYKMVQ